VASVVLCAASVLLASDTPKPASAKQPVTARTDLMKTMVRVEGTVSWPTSGGSPTATAGATACEQVKVAATKETPSGGMMPKTETLGETTGKPVDAADRSKGCTYALMGLPSGQPLKMSARFTGAWSAPLGGGFVGSTAVTATLQPGTTKQNFALVVNAVK
jgi:hypothetical protein